MTYEEKRDYLNRYQSALARARELTEDIARLQSSAEHPSQHLTGMPGGGSHDRLARIEDRKEDKERQLARLHRRLPLLRSYTLRAIRAAPSACQDTLTAIYIDGLTLRAAAAYLKVPRTRACRLHRVGVESILL